VVDPLRAPVHVRVRVEQHRPLPGQRAHPRRWDADVVQSRSREGATGRSSCHTPWRAWSGAPVLLPTV
jgi:hypothetical protein